MYHRTMILGRLGRDPDARFTPDGTAVTTINVAVDDGWGENKTTVWYRVTSWRKTAENVAQYTHKGDLVLCEGRMRQVEPYQAKDGTWKCGLEMTADNVRFIQTKRTGQSEAGADVPDVDDAESIPF